MASEELTDLLQQLLVAAGEFEEASSEMNDPQRIEQLRLVVEKSLKRLDQARSTTE